MRFVSTTSSYLTGYVDSDWAGCPDTRRSTMGYCIFLGENLVSWAAKKQVTVSQSSTEAEYKALSTATSELMWISYLLRDIGIPLSSIRIYSDNMGATQLAANPIFHARTKHIEVSYHFLRDLVCKGLLSVHFVRSSNQLADIFTKGLSPSVFHRFWSKLA